MFGGFLSLIGLLSGCQALLDKKTIGKRWGAKSLQKKEGVQNCSISKR